MKKFAVIVAGGSGTRMGNQLPKQFLELNGIPILMHTIQRFFDFDPAITILVVLPAIQIKLWEELCRKNAFLPVHQIIEGGSSRFQSVRNGLNTISEKDGIVAIHDGVRPFVSNETISKSFDVALQKGNAIASVKPKDSIRIIENETTNKAIDRNKCVLIQTPQTFQVSLIKKAFESPESEAFTDDASVLESIGVPINLIDGSYENIKITTPEDMLFAKAIISVIPNKKGYL